MDTFKHGYIPMQERLDLNKTQGALTPEEVKRMQNVPYASAVGSIMYAVRYSRPDTAFAQNLTSRSQQNPGKPCWTAVKTILKYLRNTKDIFLVYGGNPEPELRVDWRSRLEELQAKYYYNEAEYIAASEAAVEAVWIRKFISGFGIVPTIRGEHVITEYLVNISKRRAFWSLNEDILKITILKTNTPYPSRKIWRIRACTHQRPQRKEDQYAVLGRSLAKHFKTLSLDESRSPNFDLFSNKEEYSEEDVAENNAENNGYKYMSKTRADYGSGIARPKIEDKDNVPTGKILDSRGAIPSKTAADAKTRSTETSDGLAAIQAQLNNLGREIKKVNEKVYAAQVGCEQCKGPHYTKDCPLKEEGKTLEEAYYT
ncbi:hypothetical protein Tco_0316070 [Tanacetum coccineum]